MTGVNHGITGAAIALVISRPELAIPLSFASHFVCDALPHFGLPAWNAGQTFGRNFNLYLTADFLAAVSLMALFGLVWFPDLQWVIWGSMIAAAIPDAAWAYYGLYKEHIKGQVARLDPLSRFHSRIQWSQTPVGALMEASWFGGMFLVVLAFRG